MLQNLLHKIVHSNSSRFFIVLYSMWDAQVTWAPAKCNVLRNLKALFPRKVPILWNLDALFLKKYKFFFSKVSSITNCIRNKMGIAFLKSGKSCQKSVEIASSSLCKSVAIFRINTRKWIFPQKNVSALKRENKFDAVLIFFEEIYFLTVTLTSSDFPNGF